MNAVAKSLCHDNSRFERPLNLPPVQLRALLAGDKSQLRLPMKRQPPAGAVAELYPNSITAHVFTPGRSLGGGEHTLMQSHFSEHCPLGRDGDRVWIRESWRASAAAQGGVEIAYAVDGSRRTFPAGDVRCIAEKNRPPGHLPRWASRLLLEIVDVRVARIQSTSEADAAAEGAAPLAYRVPSARAALRYFWEDSGFEWDCDPWVWVLDIRVVS